MGGNEQFDEQNEDGLPEANKVFRYLIDYRYGQIC